MWLCRAAIETRLQNARMARRRRLHVLDPAVGDGVFLQAMEEQLRQRGLGNRARLYGMDLRPEAVHQTQSAVPEAATVPGNFLLDDPPGPDRYDLIIGNPPYLGQRDVVRLDYGPELTDRFGYKDDLYVYFLQRSLSLLDDGGVLAMVTSDSWLTLAGKEHLRRRLLEHRLESVLRLPDATFQRNIGACAFVLVRGRRRATTRFLRMPVGSKATRGEPLVQREASQGRFLAAPRAMVFDPTPENLAIQAGLGRTLGGWLTDATETGQADWSSRRQGDLVPLASVIDIKDVGIHTRNCRHRLFHAERKHDGMQRLLQGKQIERYRVWWDRPSARHRWVDVTYEPRPGVKGVGRGGRPSRRDEYWDWQGDPAVHHAPQRILLRQTGDCLVAALLRQNGTIHYTDNTLFTGLLRDAAGRWGLTWAYVLAYLNSRAATRVYRYLSQEQGRRQAQIKINLLRVLPLRLPATEELARITDRTERLIDHRARDRAGGDGLAEALDDHFDAMLNLPRSADGKGGPAASDKHPSVR